MSIRLDSARKLTETSENTKRNSPQNTERLKVNFKVIQKKGKQQVASATEKYLIEKIAPELLSY